MYLSLKKANGQLYILKKEFNIMVIIIIVSTNYFMV